MVRVFNQTCWNQLGSCNTETIKNLWKFIKPVPVQIQQKKQQQ